MLQCLKKVIKFTLKLPDDLCREAWHRAVDESKSLSAWIADLVAAKVRSSAPNTLLHALGDETLTAGEPDLPERHSQIQRRVQFP